MLIRRVWLSSRADPNVTSAFWSELRTVLFSAFCMRIQVTAYREFGEGSEVTAHLICMSVLTLCLREGSGVSVSLLSTAEEDKV